MKKEKYIRQRKFQLTKVKALFLLAIITTLTSCVTVREYEMVYINDPDMALSDRKTTQFETAFQVYREGASGANGGKSGGGCGCN